MAQLRFAAMPGGANTVSLESAQSNYVAYGASQRSRVLQVRTPVEGETRDPGWHLLDRRRDNLEEPRRGQSYADSYPVADTTVLYYWRASYWRRISG